MYALDIALINEDTEMIFAQWVEDIHEYDLDENGRPDFGALYRWAQSEYGRCTSSIYVDVPNEHPKRVGWYFMKRDQYDRGEGSYLQGAWVSVVERQPETRSFVEVAS